jgi:hypothetical protein
MLVDIQFATPQQRKSCLQARSDNREQGRLQEIDEHRYRVPQTATSLRFREIGIDIQADDGC